MDNEWIIPYNMLRKYEPGERMDDSPWLVIEKQKWERKNTLFRWILIKKNYV